MNPVVHWLIDDETTACCLETSEVDAGDVATGEHDALSTLLVSHRFCSECEVGLGVLLRDVTSDIRGVLEVVRRSRS
jgi:hypothetical protein